MITLLRSEERRHVQHGRQESWLSFHPHDRPGSPFESFAALVGLDELRLPPDATLGPQPHLETEVVTYVYEGALAHQDSGGPSGVMHAGEFSYAAVDRKARSRETNASRTNWARVFRISLRPPEVGLVCASERKHFAAALRHNVLRAVASFDGRRGSLLTRQDAVIYSSVLDPGHHLIHEIAPHRRAWLHLISGEARSLGIVLTPGDGVGATMEHAISLTAQGKAEIMLIDLGPEPRPGYGTDAPVKDKPPDAPPSGSEE